MALNAITDNIWSIPGEVKLQVATYFPCRALVILQPDGRIILHSPVTLSTQDVEDINDIGEVAHIIAPNTFHHMFLPDAINAFPNATVWGAPGLAKKRQDITFDKTLGQDPAPWSDVMEGIQVQGCPQFNEWVFFHKPTQSLIVTDLIFNMHTPRGWGTKSILRMAGVYKKTMQSRLWRTICKDRGASKRSVQQMLSWPFDRLIMAHGDIIESDARAPTEAALHWMLRD